jgi:hypothetical protein
MCPDHQGLMIMQDSDDYNYRLRRLENSISSQSVPAFTFANFDPVFFTRIFMCEHKEYKTVAMVFAESPCIMVNFTKKRRRFKPSLKYTYIH